MRGNRALALAASAFLACVGAPAASAIGGEAETVPDYAKELMGCWQGGKEITDKDVFRFEPKKWTYVSGGQVQMIGRVRKFEPGKVTVHYYGQDCVMEFAVKDDGLAISMGEGKRGQMLVFSRLKEAPPEIDLKPLKLGPAKDADEEKVKEVRKELEKRIVEDQAVRTDPGRRGDMQKVDAENTAWLKKTVAELGWIDATRFGAKASDEAFLIVQHSGDLPLMSAALPEIEKDVKAKKLDAQGYALLYDRLQLMLGEKQKYGTQLGQNSKGQPVVLPLVDKAKVEEFRKELGLFTLKQYLGMFQQMNGGKDVGFADEE